MGIREVSEFNKYSFLEGNEEFVAQSFNYLNKQFFHNLRTEALQEMNRLVPDFKCPEDYFYRRAQLEGQVAVLGYLIDLVVEDSVETTDV
jgi:hypothetical protein